MVAIAVAVAEIRLNAVRLVAFVMNFLGMTASELDIENHLKIHRKIEFSILHVQKHFFLLKHILQ